jgi:2-(1,2-epoxy-1,2-dihydrophenyl)acetyl-CoA isomerase
LTGGALSAAQAEQWGLIWSVVDDDAFEAEVERLTVQLANAPTQGLAAAKRAIRGAWSATLEQQLSLESELQRECGLTLDYREGVNAFKARRTPRFQGR